MAELNAIHGRRFARAGDEYYLGSDLFMDGQSSVNSIALTGKAHVHEHKLRSMLYGQRSEEHTSELQSLMRISYAVFCLKKKKNKTKKTKIQHRSADQWQTKLVSMQCNKTHN